ncbi:MAG: GMP synthase-like glutamine amidotransferase [Desulforhopalus sp.]|jgi:GMP synthase-like glutamine amidotransferase
MQKKNILILNLLFETSKKTSFDKRITEAFLNLDTPYDTIYLNDLRKFDRFDHYTHLLISGSTESATDEKEWYPDLDAIIHRFISDEKSILGVCFGHQFLVRHVLGKEHVRKSSTPELGWTDITLSNNPIFRNIDSLKSGVFHYDEVFGLGKQFEITASSNRCAIHGFQIKGKPIWGVQFHPDFMYQDVFSFVEEVRKKDGQFDEIHCQTAISYEEFRVNDRVFKNWIEIS